MLSIKLFIGLWLDRSIFYLNEWPGIVLSVSRMLGCQVNSIQNRKLAADTSSFTSHIVLELVGNLENKNTCNGNIERTAVQNVFITWLRTFISTVANKRFRKVIKKQTKVMSLSGLKSDSSSSNNNDVNNTDRRLRVTSQTWRWTVFSVVRSQKNFCLTLRTRSSWSRTRTAYFRGGINVPFVKV